MLALEGRQLAMLAALYDRVANQELGTLRQMETDQVRVAIDDGISQTLDLPDLAVLRALPGQEPIVCGATIDRPGWPERDDVQLEFELL